MSWVGPSLGPVLGHLPLPAPGFLCCPYKCPFPSAPGPPVPAAPTGTVCGTVALSHDDPRYPALTCPRASAAPLRRVQLPFSQAGVFVERSSSYLKVVARLGLVFMWNQDDSLLVSLGQVGAAACGRWPPEREGVFWVRATGKAGGGRAPGSPFQVGALPGLTAS